MDRKSAVPCERLFRSGVYIVNKMRSSLEANTVIMLVCLRSWLFVDIWARKRVSRMLFTIFNWNWSKMSHFGQYM